MHILVVSELYPPDFIGGYEISCQQVVDGLRRRGHRVTVLTTASSLAADAEHPDTHRCLCSSGIHGWTGAYHSPTVIHRSRVSFFFNDFQVLKAIREMRPQIVYLFSLVGLGVMGLIDAIKTLGIAWVWQLGDKPDVTTHVSTAVRTVFATGDGNFSDGSMIVVSERLRREIIASGITLGRVHCIPYWGQVGRSRPPQPRQANGPTRFINAGYMGEHKGVHLIVEAAALLAARGQTGFQVDCYGPGDFRPFVQKARGLGVERYVRFHGPVAQAELYELYGECDVCLFPTWHRDPFGMVPVEAAMSGRPAIMTYGCGAAEWFVHDVNCLKIRRNSDDLAAAMERLIRNGDFRCSLGRRAMQMARRSLDFERALTRIESVLEQERRELDWDGIDWQSLYKLADVKDHLASFMSLQGF